MLLEVINSWVGVLVGIVAGLAALGKLTQLARRAVLWAIRLGHKIDRLDDIASYELQHNGGGSIKDAVSRIPQLERDFHQHVERSRERGTRVDEQLAEQAATISNLAEALPVIARSTPPDESAHPAT